MVRVLCHHEPSVASLGASFLESIDYLEGDIRDANVVRRALEGCELVFNFAGRSGTVASNALPFEDLDTNVRGELTFLEACGDARTRLRVIFPSSRLVYEPTTDLPVKESAATRPISIYGIHKLTAENYHRLYHRLGRIESVVLRITNPYGPFQRREQNRYGIINWFIHRAVNGLDLPVYGRGTQLRDYVHIDDVVNAFLLAGAKPEAGGMTFNIGSGKGVSFVHMAELVMQTAGTGEVRFVDWPADAAGVETGDFVADISLVEKVLGWRPHVTLDEGVANVVAQYRAVSQGDPAITLER